MAELVVSMVVGPLLSLVKEKASSYLLEQYKVMEGMEEQHKILMRKLPAILDVITDAEEEATRREGVKAWLKEVKTVAYQANEAFDEFSYEALRREAKEKGHILRLGFKGMKLFPTHNRVAFRNKMGNKLSRIVQTIEVLVAEMNAFGFNNRKQAPAPKEWRETDSILIDYGNIATKSRDAETQKIVKILIDRANVAEPSVLPIVGMGGLGKTTLAQLIYNHPDVKKHFELHKWVCVSDEFDVFKLANKICSSSGKNLEEAQKKLQDELKGKRYLIVLDDVWNENGDKWEKLKASLKHGGNGCVVLTTTRKEGVAKLMGTIEAHDIELLDAGAIKKIIETKAFGSQDNRPADLLALVDDVVQRCAGSPLAAKALGSVLRGKTSQEWKAVLSKSIAHNKDDKILPILKLSYDDLPSHMKQCFAFCAVFPKDFEIDMELLIQLWMANGFVPKEKDVHLETTGKHIFEELVSRSFFQDVKQVKQDNDVDWYCPRTNCKIHDLMHDVALSAMENEVATIADEKPKQNEFLPNTCRHIALLCDEPEAILNSSLKTRSPAIQTLLCGSINSSLHHLVKYSSMRALLFSPSKATFLLKPKYLRHLRYLDVSRSDIESLPEDISILYHLHTLDVSYCENLGQLPKQIKYMTALRHLYTHRCENLKSMPPKLGQLTSLQTLSNFVVGIGSDCSSIGELQYLNSLSGSLLLNQLENVTDAIDAKMANLGNKNELTALSLRWTKTKEKPHCHKVLEGLEAPHGLKALRINDYLGTSFPVWMGTLPNMVELHLYDCKRLKNLPPLGQVTTLQVLCLEGLEKLECLCSGDTFFNFPNLKELMLVRLPGFDRWCEVNCLQREKVIFPHLEKLSIKKCEKLTALPEAAPLGQSCGQIWSALPALKILKLKDLERLHRWEVTETTQGHQIMFPHLEKLSIRNCKELIALPEAPLLEELCGVHYKMARSAFPALIVLKLKELENFQKWGVIDEATQGQQIIFPRLTNLSIEKCQNLIALPEGPLLQELCGGEYERVHSAFPKLKVLELKKLENFERLERVGATQGGDTMFPHLEELLIRDCPKMTALPAGRSSLFALPSGKVAWRRSFSQAYDFLCLGLRSLPGVSSVWEGSKQTAPSSLAQSTVGHSDITTRSSSFPRLKKLKFSGLKSFKSWGMAEAIDGEQWMFPNLEIVQIDGSPELTTLPEGPKLSSLEIEDDHPQILAAILRLISSLSELKFSAETDLPAAGAFELADSNNIKLPLTKLELGQGCDLLLHSNALALWTCFAHLQDLKFWYCDALVYWPEEELQSLVSLKNLEIWCCNNLIGYPQAAPSQTTSERSQLLPNLESLDIRDCESLVEIFNMPASLKAMQVRGCPKVELESILGKQQDRPTLNQGVSTDVMASTVVPQLASSTSWDQFLPYLESLTIWQCGSLSEVVNLPPSIREVNIWRCGKLQLLSGQLDALQTLKIDACPKLRSLESTSGEFQMLERIYLENCESLAPVFPNGPQAYSSLRDLTIKNCPSIKSLPSSLQQRLNSLDDDDKDLDARYQGAKLLKPKTWKYASWNCK